ncbi:MAG: hypothetical protein WA667_10760 [Candidatus Nitrosopolaris sp.]
MRHRRDGKENKEKEREKETGREQGEGEREGYMALLPGVQFVDHDNKDTH